MGPVVIMTTGPGPTSLVRALVDVPLSARVSGVFSTNPYSRIQIFISTRLVRFRDRMKRRRAFSSFSRIQV